MYFPKTQIIPDLYTNGGEYCYASNKQEYKGYYWRLSNGKAFTGKTPQDTPTDLLIPIVEPYTEPNGVKIKGSFTEVFDGYGLDENETAVNINYEEYNEETVNTYVNLKNINTNNKIPNPVYTPVLPVSSDYQIGEFRRFFCKKTNEIIYIEIDKETYDKLVNKSSTILYQFYQPFNLPWKLTGDKEQVYKTNKNIVELTIRQQKLPMFNKYLKNDYLKYYK